MLTSNLFLLTAASVNAVIPTSAVFCIFLMCINGSLILSLSSMPLRWLCNCLESTEQTRILSKNHSSLLALVNYMIIVSYFRIAVFFYHQVYLISPMASSTPLTLFILSTPLTLSILSISLTILILCSPTLETKGCNIMVLIYLGGSNLRRQL